MTTVETAVDAVATTDRGRRRPWLAAAGGCAALVVVQQIVGGATEFPERWYARLADPIRDFQSWVRDNRTTNVVLANVIRPIGDALLATYDWVLSLLVGLPWFWLPLLTAAIIIRSGRWASAAAAAAGLLFIEFAGLHEAGMETITLMVICVVLAVAVGLPLGVWAGLHPRVERVVRPVLDAMQSLPTTIYLVPAVLFFGILQTPAVVATIAFAVPPMVRITSLGIRQVPRASVEAGEMFGSSTWQLLRKVQLPQAVDSLVTALNQTIMASLGMVVLAALVGAGGLGAELIETLRLRSPGRGFVIGVAVFAVAVALDRLSRAIVDRSAALPIRGRTYWLGAGTVLVGVLVVAKAVGWTEVPWTFDTSIAEPIDDLTVWVRDTFGDVLQSINDFVVADVVIRIRDLLGTTLAWWVLIPLTTVLAWFVRGWRTALFSAVGLLTVGLMGMWALSIETLAQLIVAVLIAVLVAVPLGIFVGRRPRVDAAVSPLLDALQTFPSLIYAVPFVMIFAVGYLPGILATVLYAIPPGVRLTSLAIRGVDGEALEASTTFGATNRQRLWGVHVPLALPGIALAVNQVIMMSVSMVIITGLVGGQGLGFQAVTSLITQDTGLGVEVGVSMLVMTIILDRLSEGVALRLTPATRVPQAHPSRS